MLHDSRVGRVGGVITLAAHGPSAWDSFQKTGEATNPLSRAWARARANGVDPDGHHHQGQIDDSRNLELRRTELESVIRHAGPVFERFAPQLSASDFILLLADLDGVVLARAGGGEFADVADRVRLIEGAHWSEPARGTNAIGTALEEGVPVTVLGAAHYARPNRNLVCYAAPVRAPDDRVVAVVDATSMLTHANPLAQALVQSVAHTIEEVLRVHAWPAHPSSNLRVLSQAVRSCPHPALVLEGEGRVRAANPAIIDALGGTPYPTSGPLRIDVEHALGLGREELQSFNAPIPLAPSSLLGRRFPSHRLIVEPVLDHPDAFILFLEPFRQKPAPCAIRRSESHRHPTLPASFSSLAGEDEAFRSALATAAQVAPTTLPVLLLAETGTGKDLVARAIHGASMRGADALVSLNCGSLTPELVASELFGYGPGAFTGANKR
ncbi:MAG: sigma 54-interacting transcriptional regulator, partial [Myxococcota bacterium]